MCQVSYHKGHQFAIPSDSVGARGRSAEDGGQGRREVQLQAVTARTES